MININSPAQLSVLFFGGTVKVKEVQPILNELGVPIVTKTGKSRGQVKTKKVDVEKAIKGLGLKPLDAWKNAKEGVYSTDESVLSILAKGTGEGALIAQEMLELRGMTKLMSTYFEGFDKYIEEDSCIRGSLVHVITITGRTASNKPNLQNLPN